EPGLPIRTDVPPLKYRGSYAYGLAFSPDGSMIVSPTHGCIWDANTGKQLILLNSRANNVAFSPDGKLLAVGSQIWDWTKKRNKDLFGPLVLEPLFTLKSHAGGVTSLAFSPDGKLLASASGDATVRIRSRTNWREITTFKRHTAPVNSVGFSPDRK